MAFLEIKQLKKSFGALQVLKGIDVSLEEGQVLVIIGSSGGGKTTLMRCMNFLETPDSGEIIVDGKTVFFAGSDEAVAAVGDGEQAEETTNATGDGEIALPAEEEKTTKRKAKAKQKTKPKKVEADNRLTFGLVFQSFHLFPQYTALKNVTLAMDVKSENELKAQGVKFFARKAAMKEKRAENVEAAKTLLERVGLGEKMEYYPYQLSGGQQQRVAIARALALSPQVLCFDEPTSALDPELTGEVLRVIKDLRDEGRTMVIVTHEMEFARNVADKVIFIADGEIAEEGTPAEVFDEPKNEKTKLFLRKEN